VRREKRVCHVCCGGDEGSGQASTTPASGGRQLGRGGALEQGVTAFQTKRMVDE
jgi:hypothetical protein